MTEAGLYYESRAARRGAKAVTPKQSREIPSMTTYPYVGAGGLFHETLAGASAASLALPATVRASEPIVAYDLIAASWGALTDLGQVESFAVLPAALEEAGVISGPLTHVVGPAVWPNTLLIGSMLGWQLGGPARNLEAVGDFPMAYASEDWPFVARFLGSNPALLPPLRELPKWVRQVFSDDESLELSRFRDPDDGTEQLVASIWTALHPRDALDRLYELDRDWWLDHATKLRGRLTVTLEYR